MYTIFTDSTRINGKSEDLTFYRMKRAEIKQDGGQGDSRGISITRPAVLVKFPTQKGVLRADLALKNWQFNGEITARVADSIGGSRHIDKQELQEDQRVKVEIYINLYRLASPYQKDNAGTGRPAGVLKFFSPREMLLAGEKQGRKRDKKQGKHE